MIPTGIGSNPIPPANKKTVVKIQHTALTNKPVDATIELNKATKSIETVAEIFKILFHVVLFTGTI